eukprot:scaffold7377_cov389-Prasinococcus_capsulatus_cf.AAC.23
MRPAPRARAAGGALARPHNPSHAYPFACPITRRRRRRGTRRGYGASSCNRRPRHRRGRTPRRPRGLRRARRRRRGVRALAYKARRGASSGGQTKPARVPARQSRDRPAPSAAC